MYLITISFFKSQAINVLEIATLLDPRFKLSFFENYGVSQTVQAKKNLNLEFKNFKKYFID